MQEWQRGEEGRLSTDRRERDGGCRTVPSRPAGSSRLSLMMCPFSRAKTRILLLVTRPMIEEGALYRTSLTLNVSFSSFVSSMLGRPKGSRELGAIASPPIAPNEVEAAPPKRLPVGGQSELPKGLLLKEASKGFAIKRYEHKMVRVHPRVTHLFTPKYALHCSVD